MRFFYALLSCLLSLAGCQDKTSLTMITHASEDGRDLLFAKTTYVSGIATFRCFDSRSGRCHYRVYSEGCDATASSPAAKAACAQRTLEEFQLEAGQSRQVSGLPRDFRQCVASEPLRPGSNCVHG